MDPLVWDPVAYDGPQVWVDDGWQRDALAMQLADATMACPRALLTSDCVRSTCDTLAASTEARQACECAAWRDACVLGADAGCPRMQDFCARLRDGNTVCDNLDYRAVSAMSVVAPAVLDACAV